MIKYLLSVILALMFSLVETSAQKKVKVVELDGTKSLAEVLGDEKLEIDSLVIRGKLKHTDFPTICESSYYGKLLGLNMYDCDVENDSIPKNGLNILGTPMWHIGRNCTHHLTSITLPKNLRAVGPYGLAYNHCSKLELPSTLQVIDDYAFCAWWLPEGKIVIPDGVKRIGKQAFYCFRRISEISIPSSVCEIDSFAFATNYNVSKITFNEGLKVIRVGAFQNCSLVEELVLPSTVTEMERSVFFSFMELKKLVLPPKLKILPKYTFNCAVIYDMTWPEELEMIGEEALEDYRGDTLILPDALKEIKFGNFKAIDNARLIVMPRNLSKLGAQVFGKVGSLKEMYVKNPLPPELSEDFDANSCLTNLPSNAVLYVPTGSLDAYKENAFFGKFKIIKESDKYTSGIRGVYSANSKEPPAPIYNLNGQRVENPQKGYIYIQQGKKFVAR